MSRDKFLLSSIVLFNILSSLIQSFCLLITGLGLLKLITLHFILFFLPEFFVVLFLILSHDLFEIFDSIVYSLTSADLHIKSFF